MKFKWKVGSDEQRAILIRMGIYYFYFRSYCANEKQLMYEREF